MKSSEKEKICISCEGRISFSTEVCPFCAHHQTQAKAQPSFQTPIFQHQSLEESLTSLYTPPYQGKRPHFVTGEESTHELPMVNEHLHYKEVNGKTRSDPLLTTVDEEPASKSSFWPTLFLIAGANVFILGLMQLFFSKNGILRLEWDANYWFFYCLLGAPLLYFGYRKINELKD